MISDERIAAQRAEFDACARLATQWRRLEMTAIVDDDYPSVRADYESALAAFMLACQENGRQLPATDSTALNWGRDMDTLAQLRRANLSRMPRFGHGNLHSAGSWTPMKWGCAIAGEMGELQEVVLVLVATMSKKVGALCNTLKKYERQLPSDPAPDELLGQIADELADVFIYGDLLAAFFDLVTARIIAHKFNRTSKKLGFPERIEV